MKQANLVIEIIDEKQKTFHEKIETAFKADKSSNRTEQHLAVLMEHIAALYGATTEAMQIEMAKDPNYPNVLKRFGVNNMRELSQALWDKHNRLMEAPTAALVSYMKPLNGMRAKAGKSWLLQLGVGSMSAGQHLKQYLLLDLSILLAAHGTVMVREQWSSAGKAVAKLSESLDWSRQPRMLQSDK